MSCPHCGGTGEVYSAFLSEDIDCLICSGSGLYTGPNGAELTVYHGDDETCDRPDCYHCAVPR